MPLDDHEAYCDYCKQYIGKVTDEWISHYGYQEGGRPKKTIECLDCFKKFMTGKYICVPGVGAIEMSEQQVENVEQRKRGKSEFLVGEIRNAINFVEIDGMINEGGFKLSRYAQDKGWNPSHLRVVIDEHYGDRIVSKRGRNGGIFWSTNQEG